jgi:hypothetical protein
LSWPAHADHPVIAAGTVEDGHIGDYWIIRFRG